MRLFPKVLFSFVAVIVAGIVTVSLLANQAAAREVQAFMFNGGMASESALAQELAGYYRGHGSWNGVTAVLTGDNSMGGMMGQQVIVANGQGQIVADTTNQRLGEPLTSNELAKGVAIEVDGRQIGTLIAQSGMAMGSGTASTTSESDLVGRVNRAIWLAAAVAGGLALIVGGLLAYSLVQPVQQLTEATAAVAGGDLTRRVPTNSKDEIGQLAVSFNTMAENLQQAERLRQDLTADIAHELRNPLAVLQSNIEAIVDGVLPPTADNLQPLLDQTQLLSRLVNDLRTLALAEAGQLQLQRAPTNPGELTQSVVAHFASLAAVKHINLSVEVDPALPLLSLDRQRVEQVLGNLLGNAIRHTPENGQVTCRVIRAEAAQSPSLVTFSVSDTGSGIPPKDLPHIFERFYRVDRSRSRLEGGSGLGLAIARQLVEAHGGNIGATSQRGAGTEVWFTLPFAGENKLTLA